MKHDPFAEKSGLKLTVEPSKPLLIEIDNFCALAANSGRTVTREEALLTLAHGGVSSMKVVEAIMRPALKRVQDQQKGAKP